MLTNTPHARSLAIDAAHKAAVLIARDEVRDQWDEPSALDEMTVGALAAHLTRATGAVVAYLDRTDPERRPDEGQLLTKTTYFHAALDAPIHDQIKSVSASEASVGHQEVAERSKSDALELEARLATEPPDRMVGALGGRMLSLDDFCATRLIETLMHIDDLAHSVGVPTPDVSPDGTGEVIDILVGIARHRHGDWALIHALGRSERSNAVVFPVF